MKKPTSKQTRLFQAKMFPRNGTTGQIEHFSHGKTITTCGPTAGVGCVSDTNSCAELRVTASLPEPTSSHCGFTHCALYDLNWALKEDV